MYSNIPATLLMAICFVFSCLQNIAALPEPHKPGHLIPRGSATDSTTSSPSCYRVEIATPTYPPPAPCSGWACFNFQDASVVYREEDRTFFRYSKSNHSRLGISVATAKSLSGDWEYEPYTIIPGAKSVSVNIKNSTTTHLWAPEIHYVDGTYYLYYATFDTSLGEKTEFAMDISVATSPSMAKETWTDHGSINIPPGKPYTRLGPNLLVNSTHPSGTTFEHHLSFGSYQSGLFGTNLSESLLKVGNPNILPQELVIDILFPPIPDPGKFPNRTEASWQLQHGSDYFIFYSRGNCCSGPKSTPGEEYRVEVCRSKTPYTDYIDRNEKPCAPNDSIPNGSRTIFLQSHSNNSVFAPGSVGVIRYVVDSNALKMYYQYENNDTKAGRTFGWNYLGFDCEGWPYLATSNTGI